MFGIVGNLRVARTTGATKKLLHHMNLTYGIDIVEIKLEFPITTEEVLYYHNYTGLFWW